MFFFQLHMVYVSLKYKIRIYIDVFKKDTPNSEVNVSTV
jgi:hypothetical protein